MIVFPSIDMGLGAISDYVYDNGVNSRNNVSLRDTSRAAYTIGNTNPSLNVSPDAISEFKTYDVDSGTYVHAGYSGWRQDVDSETYYYIADSPTPGETYYTSYNTCITALAEDLGYSNSFNLQGTNLNVLNVTTFEINLDIRRDRFVTFFIRIYGKDNEVVHETIVNSNTFTETDSVTNTDNVKAFYYRHYELSVDWGYLGLDTGQYPFRVEILTDHNLENTSHIHQEIAVGGVLVNDYYNFKLDIRSSTMMAIPNASDKSYSVIFDNKTNRISGTPLIKVQYDISQDDWS